VKTIERLNSAIRCMARHLNPGGLLVLEPWFTPEAWRPNTVHGLFVDEPELKIARVNTSFTVDGVSVFDLHYLVGTPEGTQHIQEHHELGLFTVDEMKRAMLDASLDVHYEEGGFTGRGIYIGVKPAGCG